MWPTVSMELPENLRQISMKQSERSIITITAEKM